MNNPTNTYIEKGARGIFFTSSIGESREKRAETKFYYVKDNHLGNVLVVVSDRKIGVDANSDNIVDYYTADVVAANDYYAFGAPMPGRQFNSNSYRYGFNGQEKTDEVSGNGNHLDFKFRGYDPRTGRMWSVDPLTNKYPWNSPYAFGENSPIAYKELEGKEKLEAFIGGRVVTPALTVPIGISIKYDFNTNISVIAVTTYDSKKGPISVVTTYNGNTGEHNTNLSSLPVPSQFFTPPADASTYWPITVALGLAWTSSGDDLRKLFTDYPQIGEAIFGKVDASTPGDKAEKLMNKFSEAVNNDQLKISHFDAPDEYKTVNGKTEKYKSDETIRTETTDKAKGTYNVGTDVKVNVDKVIIDYTDQTKCDDDCDK